ncbi:MAG: DUF4124 domain-containing protein [bacterium]|nr:DUF4124 domain-containing protein [bacterium]
MTKLGLFILFLAWLSATPSQAQIYRWVDKDGKVHFTDNQSRIPADRIDQSRKLLSDPVQEQPAESATPAPAAASPATTSTEPPTLRPSEAPSRLRQQAEDLKGQIEAQDSIRQDYLDELKAIRPVSANPLAVRIRRKVDRLGQSLADVEHRLDALHDELGQIELKLQQTQRQQLGDATPQSPPPDVVFDRNSHNRAYWQRRVASVRDRLNQAKQERQIILGQLSAEPTTGRRGKDVLRLVHDLDGLEQDRRAAETELQALRQKAAKAGAPPAWLE